MEINFSVETLAVNIRHASIILEEEDGKVLKIMTPRILVTSLRMAVNIAFAVIWACFAIWPWVIILASIIPIQRDKKFSIVTSRYVRKLLSFNLRPILIITGLFHTRHLLAYSALICCIGIFVASETIRTCVMCASAMSLTVLRVAIVTPFTSMARGYAETYPFSVLL